MSWAYSRSLSNGSFGYGEVGYRLALKRPLCKKPLEELTLFAPRKKCREERYGTVSNQSGSRGVQEAPTHPGGSRERGTKAEETEQDEGETKTPEKISHLEERGDDDERRMEQEEALWWSREEKEAPVVRQEDAEDPEGPPKVESPKVSKVLEKVEAPKGPLRIEVPVESSEPIDEEKCDTRDFRSKSNKEEREVGPIPVEKTSLAGSKEDPMETKEEQANPEDIKTEEGMRAMEVREYPEEKETRHSRKEGSRPSLDREESSSDVSSPSTIPVESVESMGIVEWLEEEECLEVLLDGNEYWSDSMTESSVTQSVDGWLEGEERDSPMGGWRTQSPESAKSHDRNASTREPSPRRSTVLESFCRVFPPVRTNIEVESEKNEEEKPLLREKMMLTEDQGSGSTHGEEEEESIVLHNRVYRPEVECHKRSKSWVTPGRGRRT